MGRGRGRALTGTRWRSQLLCRVGHWLPCGSSSPSPLQLHPTGCATSTPCLRNAALNLEAVFLEWVNSRTRPEYLRPEDSESDAPTPATPAAGPPSARPNRGDRKPAVTAKDAAAGPVAVPDQAGGGPQGRRGGTRQRAGAGAASSPAPRSQTGTVGAGAPAVQLRPRRAVCATNLKRRLSSGSCSPSAAASGSDSDSSFAADSDSDSSFAGPARGRRQRRA